MCFVDAFHNDLGLGFVVDGVDVDDGACDGVDDGVGADDNIDLDDVGCDGVGGDCQLKNQIRIRTARQWNTFYPHLQGLDLTFEQSFPVNRKDFLSHSPGKDRR